MRLKAPTNPIIELDRWQLTGLLFVVLVIAVGAFFFGRSIGMSSASPLTSAPLLGTSGPSLPTTASARERQIALAEVWPPTSGIDGSLSRPIAQPLPSDPTERARAQAHMQLQEARSFGLREDAPPIGQALEPAVMPQVQQESGGGSGGGFTLQISLFDSQGAAQAIAAQLEKAGSAVRIRQVKTADGQLFRVEVGDFSTSEAALAFQRRFERETGYSGVLIAL